MKILSIDVGIKNLSFCFFDVENSNENKFKIIKWDNINLTEISEKKCIEIEKSGLCNKPAKFMKDEKCYCLKHAKKQSYLMPTSELKSSFINKQKIKNLIEIADKYKIKYDKQAKKTDLAQLINEFISNICLTAVETNNASKVDLVTIGRNIQHKFDEIFMEPIDIIIIENQIGPIANKMKTIQGMLSQYFIMKNNCVKIEFISALNKLKDFIKNEKMDYKQRKKMGIQKCIEIISNDNRFKEWETFINKHSKKDDLSDCFLQGMWYINNKL